MTTRITPTAHHQTWKSLQYTITYISTIWNSWFNDSIRDASGLQNVEPADFFYKFFLSCYIIGQQILHKVKPAVLWIQSAIRHRLERIIASKEYPEKRNTMQRLLSLYAEPQSATVYCKTGASYPQGTNAFAIAWRKMKKQLPIQPPPLNLPSTFPISQLFRSFSDVSYCAVNVSHSMRKSYTSHLTYKNSRITF